MPALRDARTKIVATLGPATDRPEQIQALSEAGADVFRINTAHGARANHQRLVDNVRRVEEDSGRPLGILVDLAGPKIRLGELPGDEVHCNEGDQYTFVRGESPARKGELTSNYDRLIDELNEGDRVMLADGTVSMVVEERADDRVRCRVVQPGVIRSRQGINLPGARLSLATVTPEDREAAAWAASAGVDFVGLSFVRSADDVRELSELLRSGGSEALVVAKIEKPEALENLESIIEVAGGIMVARGDLGVEIDVARMAVVQKEIIEACNRRQKPVITATQMLESMHHSRRPTRAEATDVANAILDGTDACMLSGETAIGQYPVAAVEMMNRIALETESLFRGRPREPYADELPADLNPITQAAVYGSAEMARHLEARLMVVASHSGTTALALSKRRLFVPTVGVSDRTETLRQMSLYWGVTPLRGAPAGQAPELLKFIDDWGLAEGRLEQGDRVVMVRGTGLRANVDNAVVIHEVGAPANVC